MMNICRKFLFISLVMMASFQSQAWGVIGHRVVGQVAESYLTKKAKKELAKIMGNESLAMAANYGDFVKSDDAYRYLYNWHFINLDPGMNHEQLISYLASDTVTDVYTKTNMIISELKSGMLPADKKLLYVRLLVHFIGDMHQPMHTARKDDQGGNKVKVLWFNTPSNLHQVWDEKLVEFQELSYTEYAAAINFTSKQQLDALYKQPISEWVWNSYTLAEKIYADIKQPDQKLDYKYNYNYVAILNKQLLEAGVHLAGVLNDIFK